MPLPKPVMAQVAHHADGRFTVIWSIEGEPGTYSAGPFPSVADPSTTRKAIQKAIDGSRDPRNVTAVMEAARLNEVVFTAER